MRVATSIYVEGGFHFQCPYVAVEIRHRDNIQFNGVSIGSCNSRTGDIFMLRAAGQLLFQRSWQLVKELDIGLLCTKPVSPEMLAIQSSSVTLRRRAQGPCDHRRPEVVLKDVLKASKLKPWSITEIIQRTNRHSGRQLKKIIRADSCYSRVKNSKRDYIYYLGAQRGHWYKDRFLRRVMN